MSDDFPGTGLVIRPTAEGYTLSREDGTHISTLGKEQAQHIAQQLITEVESSAPQGRDSIILLAGESRYIIDNATAIVIAEALHEGARTS